MNGKEAEKPLKEIADALGIHGVNYGNSNIEFDFKFSKTSLNSSLHHQSNFEGTYADYAKMLSCLDGIIKNAELVEIHPNYKGNKLLKQVYVLVSAFNDGNVIIPVQLEVKEQYDKNNGLYLNVVLGQIKKEPAVKKEIGVAKAYKDLPLVTGSTISLSQLFANVNTGDNKFLKYIPDKFLSEEQIAAKRTAQKADYTKYGRYKEIFEGKPKQKFSLSDPLNAAFNQDVQDKFEKDVDDVLNGKYTSDDPLMLGTTPTVFRQIGLSALPVVITKNHVYSIAATEAQAKADERYFKNVNYHGLGAQTVKQIYSKISNPLAIIAAQDTTVRPGVYSAHRVVAITLEWL